MDTSVLNKRQSYSVLTITTLAYIMCYIVWMMLAVVGIPIRNKLHLNDAEFGVLVSTVLFTGSVARVPIGLLADRFGGRIVTVCLLLGSMVPVWLMSYAQTYWEFLIIGLFIGLCGGSFVAGMSYVLKWFPQKNHGFIIGLYGIGGMGTGLGGLLAAALIVAYDWTMVPKVYTVMLFAMAVLFWFLTAPEPGETTRHRPSFKEQLQVLRDVRILRYCQYFMTVFGSFMALNVWLVRYYVDEYGLDLRLAATFAACYAIPGTIFRVPGGWLADHFGEHKLIWLVLWTILLSSLALCLPKISFNMNGLFGLHIIYVGLNVYLFVALMGILSVAFAFGAASIFKYVAVDYPNHFGMVSGIVGLAGAFAGSILSMAFGFLSDYTGIRSSMFFVVVFMAGISLFWLYDSAKSATQKTPSGDKPVFYDGTSISQLSWLLIF